MMATRNESAELRSRRRKQRRRKERRINPHKERGGNDSEEILDAYQEVKLDGEQEKLKKEMGIKTPRKQEGPANEEPADDYQQANLDGEQEPVPQEPWREEAEDEDDERWQLRKDETDRPLPGDGEKGRGTSGRLRAWFSRGRLQPVDHADSGQGRPV